MIQRFFSKQLNSNSITVTSNAWEKINEISDKKNIFCFLFSAKSGGCNGFNYNLKTMNKKEYQLIINNDSDKFKPIILSNKSAKLLVDPESMFLLLGTTVDYIKEDFSNEIFENKFVFIPNKTLVSACGCGVSFTPNFK